MIARTDFCCGIVNSQTALHKAALRGHVDVCRFLLSRQVDVNATDHDGWTVSLSISLRFRLQRD